MDAALLARMGALLQLEIRPVHDKAIAELKQLHIAREALVKDRTAAKNRSKASCLAMLKRQNTERLKQIERQITAIEAEIEMPELGSMEPDQAASLSGLAPITRQSGRWTGKAFIRGRRANVRQALYMPALVAQP